MARHRPATQSTAEHRRAPRSTAQHGTAEPLSLRGWAESRTRSLDSGHPDSIMAALPANPARKRERATMETAPWLRRWFELHRSSACLALRT